MHELIAAATARLREIANSLVDLERAERREQSFLGKLDRGLEILFSDDTPPLRSERIREQMAEALGMTKGVLDGLRDNDPDFAKLIGDFKARVRAQIDSITPEGLAGDLQGLANDVERLSRAKFSS